MSRSGNDRVTVYLAIESLNVTASMLTERLAMVPDREWVRGETRGKTGLLWECHGWLVETTVYSTEHDGKPASQLIPIALEQFQKRTIRITENISSFGSSIETYAVLAILAEEVPGIALDHSFLKFVADVGGTLQVDLNIQT